MRLQATPGVNAPQTSNEREQLAGGRPVSPLTLLAQRIGEAIRGGSPNQPPPSNNAPSESCFTESARPTALSTGWSTPDCAGVLRSACNTRIRSGNWMPTGWPVPGSRRQPREQSASLVSVPARSALQRRGRRLVARRDTRCWSALRKEGAS